jgi:hypothetical protein
MNIMNDEKSDYFKIDSNMRIVDFIDGKKIRINKLYYFIIYDFDIRFFNNTNTQCFEINTYPLNPREILKKIIIM